MNDKDTAPIEIFEALGHPIRLKILEALEKAPSSFSDLKKLSKIESSGHLTFHLEKLNGLVALNSEGNYSLTDDGREALRLVNNLASSRQDPTGKRSNGNGRSGTALWVLGILLVASIAITAISIMNTGIVMTTVNRFNDNMFSNMQYDIQFASQHMQSAVSALEAGQFDAATIALSQSEVYIDQMRFTIPLPSLGPDYSRFYDYVLHNIGILNDRLEAVELSIANGNATEAHVEFIQAYMGGLGMLDRGMLKGANRYAITNVDEVIVYFNDLVANSTCI